MRYQRHLTAALMAALLVVVPLGGVAAQDCGCPNRDSNANGHIAGALGGGLFAGLIAAVLGLKHASEATAQPMMGPAGGLGPAVAPTVSVSTGALGTIPDSSDSAATPAAASPLPATVADARTPSGQRSIGDPAHNVAYMPPMSARDAREEGLIPAKTASILPAIAMMGAGALILGLLLLREKSRGRSRRRT
ncbi:MAG TPA: hypothetical protein VFR95_04525 [Gemmatimonadaceae bacterium]|nr:hypothetical protein [Gemmatimonadaceae bacterium]